MDILEAKICINTKVNTSKFFRKSNLLVQKEQLCTYPVTCLINISF